MNHYKTIVLIKIVSAIVISYQGCGNFEVLQEGSVSQNSSSETKSPTDNSLPEDPVLDPLPTIDTQVKKSITPYFKNEPVISVTDNLVSISSTPYDDDSVEVRVVYGAVPSGGPAPSGSALSHQKPPVVSGEKLPYTATGEPANSVFTLADAGQYDIYMMAWDLEGNNFDVSLLTTVKIEADGSEPAPIIIIPPEVIIPTPGVPDNRPADFFLSKDYGYTRFNSSAEHKNKILDATKATFRFSNCKVPEPTIALKCDENNPDGPNQPLNQYPVDLSHEGLSFRKPLIEGIVNMDAPWGPHYAYNGSGLIISYAENVTIDGARMNRVWDGIRPRTNSHGFLIKNTWLSNVRDDCIENDGFSSGKIQDSLFDGCFIGLSFRPGSDSNQGDATDNVLIEFDSTLFRMAETHFVKKRDNIDKGIVGAHMFKPSDKSPSVSVHSSIFAYDMKAIYAGSEDNLRKIIGKGSSKLKSCSNNKILWLHDDNPPQDFDGLDPCFKIYSGQQARDMWKTAKCNWIKNHPPEVTRRRAGDELECK